MLPLELLKTPSIFQGMFQKLWLLRPVQSLWWAPMAAHFITGGTVSNSGKFPFLRGLLCTPQSSHAILSSPHAGPRTLGLLALLQQGRKQRLREVM